MFFGFFSNSCKRATIKPSSFIEGFVTYYINDSLTSNMRPNDYIIKVVTKTTDQKLYIDVIGYEKDQLTRRDNNNYGCSYIKKFKVVYYGDIIPDLTTPIKLEKCFLKSNNDLHIEYDPIVFRIVLNKATLDFIDDESYKMNTLIDNRPLKKIVKKYFK